MRLTQRPRGRRSLSTGRSGVLRYRITANAPTVISPVGDEVDEQRVDPADVAGSCPVGLTSRPAARLATTTPISMYPPWATLEYASIRRTLSCSSASTFPSDIVTTARIHSSSGTCVSASNGRCGPVGPEQPEQAGQRDEPGHLRQERELRDDAGRPALVHVRGVEVERHRGDAEPDRRDDHDRRRRAPSARAAAPRSPVRQSVSTIAVMFVVPGQPVEVAEPEQQHRRRHDAEQEVLRRRLLVELRAGRQVEQDVGRDARAVRGRGTA